MSAVLKRVSKIVSKLKSWYFGLSRFTKRTILTIFSLIFLFLLIDLIFPVHTHIRYSQLILSDDHKLLNASLSSDQQWRMKTGINEVNPLLIRTIIAKEDRWFRFHPGVNPFAVTRALWQNLSTGKRVSGASTITMQVVRMLEPRKRTVGNKLIECFRAVQLELHHSKNEILELYLNLLPYGGNIQGVKAASFLYFGQEPQALSLAQIVTLAIIPNDPNHQRLGINNDRIVKERNLWLAKLSSKGIFSKTALDDAILEPLAAKRFDAPKQIPHLARLLSNTYPEKPVIQTFIDIRLQDFVENTLSNEIHIYRGMGIGNAAVVLIDNRKHEVVAYVGSAGFMENRFQGQVDGASSLRSPGSALKPFLYALAMDRGLITPKTVLQDIPQNFNGYRPQNYDETFRGRITASQALSLSLNVPAVDLANRVGVDLYNEKLSRGGLKWIGERKKTLGLSVILGGCGVTLTELTSLYSCLASGGIKYPLLFTPDKTTQTSDTLFSEQATWMIHEILTGLKRPDLPNNFENSVNLPHIAWKTGTSYGRRDAWSFGYNPDYTVGVWVGNFDGTGIPELSGADFAAPILFKIFNFLTYNQKSTWFIRPAGLDFRLVCSESGLPPNESCTNLVMDDYIPAVSPNRKCDHLVPVFVDESGSISYCRSCLPVAGYRTDYYPNLSPGLIAFYEEEQIPYRKIPTHNPLCNRVYHNDNPVITSLSDGKEYILYAAAKQQLQLAFTATSDVNKVYWYINDKFFKEASRGQKLFFTPDAGLIKISCSDDKGRNSDILVKVSFL
ncbi:MAG: penicillin-binding protein 1C [Lentimicrobiaceae bacterium]|jgi:penicillin-binding protein 1C